MPSYSYMYTLFKLYSKLTIHYVLSCCCETLMVIVLHIKYPVPIQLHTHPPQIAGGCDCGGAHIILYIQFPYTTTTVNHPYDS